MAGDNGKVGLDAPCVTWNKGKSNRVDLVLCWRVEAKLKVKGSVLRLQMGKKL